MDSKVAPKSPILAILSVALFSSAIVAAYPLIIAGAVTCPTTTDTVHGVTYSVTIQGADGSCPTTYADSSHLVHYVLSTGAAQNPYTVKISASGCVNCPPIQVYARGWADGTIFCGSPSPACVNSGPWTGSINAQVQAGKTCDTAPVFVKFSGTKPPQSNMLILEAGTGGVCGSATSTTSHTSTTHSTTTSHTTTSSRTTSTTISSSTSTTSRTGGG